MKLDLFFRKEYNIPKMSWNVQKANIFLPFFSGPGLKKNVLRDRPHPLGDRSHPLAVTRSLTYMFNMHALRVCSLIHPCSLRLPEPTKTNFDIFWIIFFLSWRNWNWEKIVFEKFFGRGIFLKGLGQFFFVWRNRTWEKIVFFEIF